MPLCFGKSTTKILVGMQRIGVLGLYEAFKDIEEAGLVEREQIAARLLDIVSRENYVPPEIEGPYRQALLREFLRSKGEPIHDLYSEIEVVVTGSPGQVRDRFVESLRSVFSEFELKPIVRLAPADETGPDPKLVIEDETILAGDLPCSAMRPLIKARLSDW